MEQVFNFLRLAKPFLELAYTAALMVAPQIAAEIRHAIDAIDRAANTPHPARGLAEITAYCQSVISGLHGIIDDPDLPNEEKRVQAADLNATLYDPMKVYQAQRGQDAAVLDQAKRDAKALLNTIPA